MESGFLSCMPSRDTPTQQDSVPGSWLLVRWLPAAPPPLPHIAARRGRRAVSTQEGRNRLSRVSCLPHRSPSSSPQCPGFLHLVRASSWEPSALYSGLGTAHCKEGTARAAHPGTRPGGAKGDDSQVGAASLFATLIVQRSYAAQAATFTYEKQRPGVVAYRNHCGLHRGIEGESCSPGLPGWI